MGVERYSNLQSNRSYMITAYCKRRQAWLSPTGVTLLDWTGLVGCLYRPQSQLFKLDPGLPSSTSVTEDIHMSMMHTCHQAVLWKNIKLMLSLILEFDSDVVLAARRRKRKRKKKNNKNNKKNFILHMHNTIILKLKLWKTITAWKSTAT